MLSKHGVPLYGPDLSEWPIWAVDVITLLTLEHERTARALDSAGRLSED